jgi:hypothetical protein
MLSVLIGSTTVHELRDPFVRRPGLLSTGRAQVRVILCSRWDAPSRLDRLRSRGRLCHQLRFSPDETQERPAADQESLDSASRSVPETPHQGG